MLIEPSYCRSCGTSNPQGMLDLNGFNQNRSWHEIYQECTGIDIRQDSFPKILCRKCKNSLISAYDFRVLTQKTYVKLVEKFRELDVKQEIEEHFVTINIGQEEEEESMVQALDLKVEINRVENKLDACNKQDIEDDDKNASKKATNKKYSKKKHCGAICPGCQAVFKLSTELKKHLKDQKGSENHLWLCDICSLSFQMKMEVYGHIIRAHKEQECPKCSEVYIGTNDYKRHLTKAHYEEEHPDKVCPHCGKMVKSLRSHIRVVHKKVKRHICEICKKSFVTRHCLEAHLRVHTNERPYECTVPGCGKTFKQSGQLKQHTIRHGPKQDFICDVCGTNVSSKYTLIEHRKIHFQIGAFKCEECSASFAKRSYLKEHIKNQHVEYTPEICSTCGGTFKNQARLNAHMKLHEGTDHICSYCNKMFLKRSRMMDHISAVHEKDRKYTCDWEGCDKVYLRREHVRRHVRKFHLGNWKSSK